MLETVGRLIGCVRSAAQRLALGIVMGLLMTSSAIAGPYSSLYVFGDSYSDTGAGYVDGNGPTAVAYLAQNLGLSLTHAGEAITSPSQSVNFAVSGATTGFGNGVTIGDALLGYGMRNQVQDFAGLVNNGSLAFDPATTLFFIAGGLNDSSLPTSTTLANLLSEAEQLRALGAQHLAFALLPTQIPAFSAVATRLNPSYENELLPALQANLPGADVWLSNWGGYFDDILLNPSSYGFTNVTDRCAGRALFGEDPTPCATPDTYFYYHDAHPSTAAHRVVGNALYQEVLAHEVPEPFTPALIVAGLVAMGWLRRHSKPRPPSIT